MLHVASREGTRFLTPHVVEDRVDLFLLQVLFAFIDEAGCTEQERSLMPGFRWSEGLCGSVVGMSKVHNVTLGAPTSFLT